ncbi:MAG: CHASE2 domain-containing protein [Legionella sp.]|nr:CHASE2 domain-containing protein [Legionella sp.]
MKKDRQSLLKMLKSKRIQICLGLLCTFFIYITNTINLPLVSTVIRQLDNRMYDQLVQFNWRQQKQTPQIALIDIDNKSVQIEGRWPWPRSKMADLINELKNNGVVTIGLDIVMAEPEVNYALGLIKELLPLVPKLTPSQQQLPTLLEEIAPQVDNDQIFARSLMDHNVVLGFLFHNDTSVRKGVLPPPLSTPDGKFLEKGPLALFEYSGYHGCLELFLSAATQAGTVTNLPDIDGSVRRGLMLASYANKLYPTLALAIAMNYMMIEHATLSIKEGKLLGIQLGGIFIPTNSHGQILVPFWGPPGTQNYYSATDILQKKIPAEQLQGSIAIIGSSMILLADLHQSPVAQSFPGMEMVANMVQGIVGQQLVTQYDWHTTQSRIYLLILGLVLAFLFAFFHVSGMLLLAFICILGVLAASFYLFVYKSLYVPLALVLALITLEVISNYAYLFIMEQRQKRKLNLLFGQYVPEEYVKELVESTDQYGMEGQVRNMTVQFSDIRDFTSISETLDATNVKRLLNTFFTPITKIIFSFRGTIDKYVGDMIVAFWGAPLYDDEHVYHAIMSSLTVVEKLPEINERMIEQNLPAVSIGIGLATGLMNVGDMGSEFRRAYTVLGDTVNLASRLQELTKFYHVSILASDGSRENQDQFIWRIIDKITVKGRKKGLTIYQPIGLLGEVPEETLIELDEYNKALDDYYAQNWSSAQKKFGMLKRKFPDVYVYQMYLERIKLFIKTPPNKNWKGVYVHLNK